MVFNIERFGGNGSHWVVGGEFLLGRLADGASGSEKRGEVWEGGWGKLKLCRGRVPILLAGRARTV